MGQEKIPSNYAASQTYSSQTDENHYGEEGKIFAETQEENLSESEYCEELGLAELLLDLKGDTSKSSSGKCYSQSLSLAERNK